MSNIDWDAILSLKLDSTLEDTENLKDELDKITPLLVNCEVDSSDPNLTTENLIKLFKVTQIILKITNGTLNDVEYMLGEKERKAATQELEISHLRSVATRNGMEKEINLLDEIQRLQQAGEQSSKEIENLEESLEQERIENAKLKTALKDEQSKTNQSQETKKRLEAELRECRTQLSTQKSRLQKLPSEEALSFNIHKKNAEISRFMEEIKMLSEEKAYLTEDYEAVTQELEAAVHQMDRHLKLASEVDYSRKLIDQKVEQIDELTSERDALRIKIEDMNDQQEKNINFQVKNTERIEILLQQSKTTNQNLSERNLALEKEIGNLKKDINNLKGQLSSAEISNLKQEIQEKDDIIESLQIKLKDTQYDLELLAYDWDRLDRIVKNDSSKDVAEDAREHTHALASLREKLEAYKKLHIEDTARIEKLNLQIIEGEKQNLDLTSKLSGFENGTFGLHEAARDVRELQIKCKTYQREIKELAAQITDLNIQASDLQEENIALRSKFGLGDSKLDTSNLKTTYMVDLEKQKSLVSRLETEIVALEEERIALKKALRLQAMDKGGLAIAFGLTAEQIVAVEDFAERLRGGEVTTLSKKAIPEINTEQLDRLVHELERCHLDQDDMKSKISILEKQLYDANENKGLLESALFEISKKYLIRGSKSKSLDDDTLADLLQKLVRIFEAKYEIILTQSISNSESIQLLKEKLRSASSLNLRENTEAVTGAMEELQKLTISVAKLEKEHAEAIKERDYWKQEAHHYTTKQKFEFPYKIEELTEKEIKKLLRQFMECLFELEEKRRENIHLRTEVEKLESEYAPILNKLKLLYLDHSKLIKSYKDQEAQFKSKFDILEEKYAAGETKIGRLEALVNDLSQGPDQMKQSLIQVQRRLIVLEVNEQALMRRYQASLQLEQMRQKQNIEYEKRLSTLESCAKLTITTLNGFREDARNKIAELQEIISQSVPKTEFMILENKLNLHIGKLRILTERERDKIDLHITRQAELLDINKLKIQCTELQLELKETKAKLENYQKLVNEKSIDDSKMEKSNLLVRIEVLELRSRSAEEREQAAHAVAGRLKQQLEEADKMYMDSKEECIKLLEKYVDLCNEYEGGAKRTVHEENIQRISKMQREIDEMKAKVDKYKNMSDLSTTQAMDMMNLRKRNEREIQILRNAVEEMQATSEHNLLIGKLNQKIIALESKEMTSNRELEKMKSKCLEMDALILNLETRIDNQDKLIYNLHLQNSSRLQNIQRVNSNLRVKLAGAVTLSQHERACSKLELLFTQKDKLEKELSQNMKETYDVTQELDRLRILVREHDEIVKGLNENDSNSRILSWHNKMKKSQIELAKCQRELLRKDKLLVEYKTTSETYYQKLEELQDYIEKFEGESDLERMEWEKIQTEMEATIARYETERDQIFQAAQSLELKDALPDRSLPIGQQLEVSLRLLYERAKHIKILELRLENANQSLSEAKKQIKEDSNMIVKKDHDLTKIQFELLQATQEHEKAAFDLKNGGISVFEKAREREKEALDFAKETVNSLQAQLEMKEKLVDKYREMLKTIRAQVKNEKEQGRSKLNEKDKLLNNLTKRQLTRFQNLELTKNHKDSTEIGPELNMIEQLEKLVSARDLAIEQLKTSFEEEKTSLESNVSELNSKLENSEQSLSKMSKDYEDARQRIVDLETKLEEAGILLSKPIPIDLSDVVSRLKDECLKKDKKIKANSLKMEDLKSQLVSATQSLAEAKLLGTRDHNGDLDEKNELYQKIVLLESKLKKSVEKLSIQNEEKERLEKDVDRISYELVAKSKLLSQKNKEIASLKALLEKTCTKSKTEIEELKSKLDQRDKQIPDNDTFLPSLQIDSNLKRTSSQDLTTEKKYQRKIQKLKEVIQADQIQLDSATKMIESLKTSYERSEKERLRMQSRFVKGRPNEIKEDQKQKAKIEQVQDLLVKSQQENLELRKTLEKVQDKASILETVNEQLKKSFSAFESNETTTGAGPVAIIEKMFNDLLEIIEKKPSQSVESENAAVDVLPINLENRRLKKELKELEEKNLGFKEQISTTRKLEEENAKLRQQIKKDTEKHRGSAQKLKELSIAKEQMIKEIVSLRKALGSFEDKNPVLVDDLQKQIIELKDQISSKNQEIQTLLNPDTDEHSRLISETRRLTREAEMWKIRCTKLNQEAAKKQLYQNDSNELGQLRKELEDLRENYKLSVKQNLIYEKQLQRYMQPERST